MASCRIQESKKKTGCSMLKVRVRLIFPDTVNVRITIGPTFRLPSTALSHISVLSVQRPRNGQTLIPRNLMNYGNCASFTFPS